MVEGKHTAARSDAELVVAFVGGDASAFAAIFDRYGPALHAFCTRVLGDPHTAADATQDAFVAAARRLGTLRDPAALRPWLYAVARNECTRHGRARDRAVPVEGTALMGAVDGSAGGVAADDVVAAAESAELATLLWDAAAGLDDKDRILLELQVRHGLQGAELAEAAGVPAGQISMATGRLQERLERAVGALLVLRGGRDDCPGLQAVLEGWDGTYSVLVRKRVARHVDACDRCGERKRALVAPLGSLAIVPAVVPFALSDLPVGLRDRVLGAVDGALAGDAPTAGGSAGQPRTLVVAAVAVVLLLVAGVAAGVRALGGDHDVASGPAATTTRIGPASPSKGSSTTRPRVTTSTAPRATTTSAVAATTTPTSPASGTSTSVPATAPPGTPTPPPTTTVPPNAAPKVGSVARSGSASMQTTCNPANDRRTISAPVSDDHGLASVVLRWTHSAAGAGEKPMAQAGGSWAAVLGPFDVAGTATYRVVATDASGRTTSSATGSVTVDPCPG